MIRQSVYGTHLLWSGSDDTTGEIIHRRRTKQNFDTPAIQTLNIYLFIYFEFDVLFSTYNGYVGLEIR